MSRLYWRWLCHQSMCWQDHLGHKYCNQCSCSIEPHWRSHTDSGCFLDSLHWQKCSSSFPSESTWHATMWSRQKRVPSLCKSSLLRLSLLEMRSQRYQRTTRRPCCSEKQPMSATSQEYDTNWETKTDRPKRPARSRRSCSSPPAVWNTHRSSRQPNWLYLCDHWRTSRLQWR